MRWVFLTVAFCFSSLASAQSATENFCAEAKRVIADAQSQLPLQVDIATQWVGASAIYSGGICRVSHEYLIDSDAIIDMAQNTMEKRGMDSSRAKLVEYYSSPKGVEDLKASMRATSESYFAEAMDIPNIRFTIHYGTSDPIKPFSIVLESGQ